MPGAESPSKGTAHDVMNVAGHRVLVGSSSDLVMAAMRAILRGFERLPDETAVGVPRYELQPAAGEWLVTVDDTVVHQGDDFLVALGLLEFHLLSGALDRTPDLFHLHGAALCAPTSRAGIILAGDSGIGKTTLALALMLRGFTSFSDDVALIEPDTLHLRPLRRAFHISSDTWPLLDELAGGRIVGDADTPPGFFSPPQWAQTSVPVRWILFPERVPGRTPALLPMQPMQAASALTECSISLLRSPRIALATTARLVGQAACYRLIVNDLSRTVDVVRQLVLSDDPTKT